MKRDLEWVFDESIKIWQELAETGSGYKPDTDYLNNCPCCEYVVQFGKDVDMCLKCEYCPVQWLPSNSRRSDVVQGACQTVDSPFHTWEDTRGVRSRKIQAKEVLKCIIRSLGHLKTK